MLCLIATVDETPRKKALENRHGTVDEVEGTTQVQVGQMPSVIVFYLVLPCFTCSLIM